MGLANVGVMCDKRFSVALTQDGGLPFALVGTTAAHELGHNFNMVHDECKSYGRLSFSFSYSMFPPLIAPHTSIILFLFKFRTMLM